MKKAKASTCDTGIGRHLIPSGLFFFPLLQMVVRSLCSAQQLFKVQPQLRERGYYYASEGNQCGMSLVHCGT